MDKLDRAFATDSWWHLFPLDSLSVSHVIALDHDAIKLELVNASVSKKNIRFKFENTWLKEAEFRAEVSNYRKDLSPESLTS